MDKKPIRFIAGVVFLLYAALALLLPLPHLCLAAIIIGIGLFVNKSVISAVGGMIFAVGVLYSAGFRSHLSVSFIFSYRDGLLAAAICLVIICFVRSTGKVLGIVAAILALVAQAGSIFTVLNYTTYGLTYRDYASDALLSLGLLLIGFAFHRKKGITNNAHIMENSSQERVSEEISVPEYCRASAGKEYNITVEKGGVVNLKRNVWHVIGILVGVAAIVAGIIFLCEGSTYIGRNYSFGADFYTEMYSVVRNVGFAINNAYIGIMSAFGWLFILGGLIDICVFASKIERKQKQPSPENADVHPLDESE